jgi:hypothetical protein
MSQAPGDEALAVTLRMVDDRPAVLWPPVPTPPRKGYECVPGPSATRTSRSGSISKGTNGLLHDDALAHGQDQSATAGELSP